VVQVDPIKPVLNAPGIKLLKLRCGWTGFKFCFQLQRAPLHGGGLELRRRGPPPRRPPRRAVRGEAVQDRSYATQFETAWY